MEKSYIYVSSSSYSSATTRPFIVQQIQEYASLQPNMHRSSNMVSLLCDALGFVR